MRNALLYTTWITLTTILLSPLLNYFLFDPPKEYLFDSPFMDLMLMFVSTWLGGLITAAIPWAILAFSIGLIQIHIGNWIIGKLLITILVEAFIYVPVFIYGNVTAMKQINVTVYAAVALASIWLYRLGEYGK